MTLHAPAPEAEPCRGGGREELVPAPLSLGLLSGLLPIPSAIHSCEVYGAVVINRAMGTCSLSGASASLLPALTAWTRACQPHLGPFKRPGRAWVTLDLPTVPASLRLAYCLPHPCALRPHPQEPGKDAGTAPQELAQRVQVGMRSSSESRDVEGRRADEN